MVLTTEELKMDKVKQEKEAKKFVDRWIDRGSEKSDTHSFWLELLENVYGVNLPGQYVEFEKRVKFKGTTKFIDAYIPQTLTLIEQKDNSVNPLKPERQSDGSTLTPFEQGKRYADNLKLSEKPRWIIVCNFSNFYIYDQENPLDEPVHLELQDLPKNLKVLDILVSKDNLHIAKEQELSIKAGNIVGELYSELHKQYETANLDDHVIADNLNKLIVRIVFLLYAEDAGILGEYGLFYKYLSQYDSKNIREALIRLFKVLDTPEDERDPFLDADLKQFPYVNGGLFRDEDVLIPPFDDSLRQELLEKASDEFDWSDISPTIFGATFESTLNPETRRSGGMHYTSIENIHKVIDPLFLDDLKAELEEIKQLKQQATREKRIINFQKKLGSLKFLDPACGSGNFLTETYISLRKLENNALNYMNKGQTDLFMLDEAQSPIQVTIDQFYGIEVNDFAVSVAKTALWIAESQMMKETADILNCELDFLPLKTNAYIAEGNALKMDWNEILSSTECSYIMGNPPFVGTKNMDTKQKNDMSLVMKDVKNYGTLDYVTGWYMKASKYIDSKIKCAFVSTNSICQGEQVAPLWKTLFDRGIAIDFAYRTFVWDSEASIKAHVHCIIIGFSKSNDRLKKIYKEDGSMEKVNNINGYLVDAPNVFIESSRSPICDVQEMYLGCDFKDDNNYILSQEEYEYFIKKNPESIRYIRKYVNAKELTNRTYRYCLWLNGVQPIDLKNCKLILERVEKVREFRTNSKSADTNRYAEFPLRPARLRYYSEERNCDALFLPRTSSQNRKYLPMEIYPKEVIGGASILMIPNSTNYTLGILSSNVHMYWMKLLCGRMKSDFRYANGLVYNTLPWPNVSNEQYEKISETAKAIVEARKLYPGSSLADLYNPKNEWMYPQLFDAHKKNDKAVMEAYGFDLNMTESEIVAELFKMYEQITNE